MNIIIEPLLTGLKSFSFYHKSYFKDNDLYVEIGTKLLDKQRSSDTELLTGTASVIPEVIYKITDSEYSIIKKRTLISDATLLRVEELIKRCYSFKDDNHITPWKEN